MMSTMPEEWCDGVPTNRPHIQDSRIRFKTETTIWHQDDALSNYSIQNRGIGIYSLVSSFEVRGRCNIAVPFGSECDPGYLTAETLGEPGSDIVPSRFSNYLTAIRSVGADGFSNTSVSSTIFTGNQMGIFLKTVDQASIKRNPTANYILLSQGRWVWFVVMKEKINWSVGSEIYKKEKRERRFLQMFDTELKNLNPRLKPRNGECKIAEEKVLGKPESFSPLCIGSFMPYLYISD